MTSPTELRGFVVSEFQRVRRDAKRSYLLCEEVFQIKFPAELTVDFGHLATLFVINREQNGKFTLENLQSFLDFCVGIRKGCRSSEFQAIMQGQCVCLLWAALSEPKGIVSVVEWIMTVLSLSYRVTLYKSVPYMAIDAVFVLFKMLRTAAALDFTPSQFLDMLQQAAESQGLLQLEDAAQDDSVPVQILKDFMQEFFTSFKETLDLVGEPPSRGSDHK